MEPTRRGFKIEAFWHNGVGMDPELVAGECKAVTDAIHDIYAQDTANIVFAELYRRAYNMVLYSHGAELYSAVDAAMAAEVQGLGRALAAAAPANGTLSFLQELLIKWQQHKEAVTSIRGIVMYMDRTFVVATGRTPVKELGIGLWRDGVVRSDDLRPRLIEAVRRERPAAGEDPDAVPGELMAGVNEMLTELGDEVYREVMDALPSLDG